MIKLNKIFNFLKQLIASPIYWENKVDMTKLEFGELRRNCQKDDFRFCKNEDNGYDVYHIFNDVDEYGDTIRNEELIAIFDSDENVLYYTNEFNNYFSKNLVVSLNKELLINAFTDKLYYFIDTNNKNNKNYKNVLKSFVSDIYNRGYQERYKNNNSNKD